MQLSERQCAPNCADTCMYNILDAGIRPSKFLVSASTRCAIPLRGTQPITRKWSATVMMGQVRSVIAINGRACTGLFRSKHPVLYDGTPRHCIRNSCIHPNGVTPSPFIHDASVSRNIVTDESNPFPLHVLMYCKLIEKTM